MGRKRLTDPESRLGAKTADQLRSLETDQRVPDSLARWAEENTPEGVITRRVLRRNLRRNAGLE